MRVVFLLLLFGLASCSSETACTEEFRTYSVSITDATDEAVIGATVSTIVKSSSQILNFAQPNANEGSYVVIDDSINLLGAEGLKSGLVFGLNQLEFQVTKDGKTVSEDYSASISACHVEGLAGPDPLVFD